MKVLYIAGSGRSGSTILDNILGQLDGFVSVGEVRFLWERGIVEDRTCGCGQPFSACPFWQAVLARAFPGGTTPDPAHVLDLLGRGTRARRIPRLAGSRARRRRFVAGGLDDLPQILTALYRAIADESGARVIVDSSKLPTYGAVLGEVPDVDLRTLHLIRDPRAAGHSWLRRKALPDKPGAVMQRQGPWHSAALWTLWNATAEVFGAGAPYRRLRYEDLIADPEAQVGAVARWLGESVTPSPFAGPHEVRLAPSHGVAGNPSRFTTGTVALTIDDAWRRELASKDRWAITALTWPLLLRHGYAG